MERLAQEDGVRGSRREAPLSDAAVGSVHVPGPVDRVHFVEEQRRYRKASRRFSLLAMLAVLITGIPACIVVTPLVFTIVLTLGHHVSVPNSDPTKAATDCNVQLQALLKPTSAAATDYSVNLKNDFTISQSCGLTGLNLWNEVQDYSIAKIDFYANTLNLSVPNAGTTKTYTTRATFKGPITFQ